MNEHLEPCPFCGAGETKTHESTHWTGRRSEVISVRIRHWCARDEGQPPSQVEIAGKTREDGVRKGNQRIAAPQPQPNVSREDVEIFGKYLECAQWKLPMMDDEKSAWMRMQHALLAVVEREKGKGE